MAGITLVAVRGLNVGKWLHNAGSIGIMAAYVILLALPVWALLRGSITHYEPIPWQPAAAFVVRAGDLRADDSWGFERIRICRHPGRRVPQPGAHHRAVGSDFSAHHRADVHFGNKFGVDVCRGATHQRDRADSANHAACLRRGRLGGADGDLSADDARGGQRQPDLHRPDAPAHDRRLGQPGAALVCAPPSAPADAREFDSLRSCAGHGAHLP